MYTPDAIGELQINFSVLPTDCVFMLSREVQTINAHCLACTTEDASIGAKLRKGEDARNDVSGFRYSNCSACLTEA